MASNSPQPERPETFFFPATLNWAKLAEVGVSGKSSPQQSKRDNEVNPGSQRSYRANKGTRSKIPIVNEDPWNDYEKAIGIFPKRHVFLARDRESKGDLVHVQQLEEGVATRPLLEIINRLSHRSFPCLLRCYQHEGTTFLVWEPVELSLSQVIGSKYSIRETELVSIVWPVGDESDR